MANPFTKPEWDAINTELDSNPQKYGFPKRIAGSALLGSFNVRKLGNASNRDAQTWNFLAKICRQFDLLAVQEIMDDLSGINKLMSLLGPDFGMIISDKTGVFPGDIGLGERLGFIFRWTVVKRGEVVSDISYDRSKVLEILRKYGPEIIKANDEYTLQQTEYESGIRKSPPSLKMPAFLSFIRQPYCVSFSIHGVPGSNPIQFMAINAHLHFGDYLSDRRQEFDALMEWINARVKDNDKAYYPNFILMGDLNLDYNDPEKDRTNIEKHLKTYNDAHGKEVHVNFPFLDPHKGQQSPYRSNARLNETFDQIGLFFRHVDLPTFEDNENMPINETGPDFGVFNFANLFSKAILGKTILSLNKTPKANFIARFEHKVSDHMPLWLRLPIPII